jgi:predicted RNase H-like HicB family nuclease
MRYRVVLERDPKSGHHVATVPGLPGLFVDAKTEKEALKLAKEGISFYLEELAKSEPGRRAARPAPAKVVTVDV